MSDMSLRLIDAIVDHHHQSDHNLNVAWTMTKASKKSLLVDARHRAEAAAEEVQECLETPKETLSYLQG